MSPLKTGRGEARRFEFSSTATGVMSPTLHPARTAQLPVHLLPRAAGAPDSPSRARGQGSVRVNEEVAL